MTAPATAVTPKSTSGYLPLSQMPIFHPAHFMSTPLSQQPHSVQLYPQPKQPSSLHQHHILPHQRSIDSTMHSSSSSKNKLGRAYNPGRPLAMSDRQKILELYEKGHKISHIARIIGVTHSCVSKIMTRYRRTGSMQPRSTYAKRGSDSGIESDNDKSSVASNDDKLLIPKSLDVEITPAIFIHRPFPIKSYSINSLLFEG
uniref:Paired domain-containing protein n=1 Tax=Steinernema glaseri TaxID=37863 RepID=A0A1I8ALA5_9BILA